MNLLPCPWGSMSRGYLWQRLRMIPFSVENVSLGNPFSRHFRMVIGLESAVSSVKLSLAYSEPPMSLRRSIQILMSFPLKLLVNTPRFETVPAARIISPSTSLMRSSYFWDYNTHLSRSPPSPPISWLALNSLISQSLISSVKACCWSWVAFRFL